MADQLLIWGRASSSNVQKVLWALAELDITFERRDAGAHYGVVDTDEYRRMNPNGRVPTLVEGDFILYESNAIVRYLTQQHGGVLVPAGGNQGHALADQWMDWAATSFTQSMSAVFWHKVRTPKAKQDATQFNVQYKAMIAGAGILDKRLGDTPWLAGEHFSMADIPTGAWMYRYYDIDIERPDLPNLQRWYNALTERDAFRKTVMTSYDELRVKE